MNTQEQVEEPEGLKEMRKRFKYLPASILETLIHHQIHSEAERKERAERAKNIIVYQMAEQIGQSEYIRNTMDREETMKIFAHEHQMDLSQMKVKRLGKYDPNKPSRPLLIMFSTAMEAKLAMRNAGKFPPLAVVKPDRTLYQRTRLF